MNLGSMQFAHDMKLPIQLIYSCVQLLELEVGSDARVGDYLRILESSADQLQSMVSSAMDGSPRATARPRTHDIVAEAREATRRCEPLARERGVTLAFRANGAEFWMPVDAPTLERVLDNLLSNALRFTPHGGRIEVCVQLRGDAVDLIVSDDGCGIAPERQERIFELGESEGGSGYGLAIVRECAARMGGSVWVNSREGQGSRFTVRLPVRPRQLAETPPPHPRRFAENPPQRQYRFVENHPQRQN